MATSGLSGGKPFNNVAAINTNVADTLAQATKALHSHRAWMKQRISSAIVPIDGEGAVVEKKQVKDIFISRSSSTGLTGDLSDSHKLNTPDQEGVHPAPPHFVLEKGSSKRRHIHNKVTPVSSVDSPSLPKVSLTGIPSQFYGGSATEPAQDARPRGVDAVQPSDDVQSQQEVSPHTKVPQAQVSKKRHKHSITIVPLDEGKTENKAPCPRDILYGTSTPSFPVANAWTDVVLLEDKTAEPESEHQMGHSFSDSHCPIETPGSHELPADVCFETARHTDSQHLSRSKRFTEKENSDDPETAEETQEQPPDESQEQQSDNLESSTNHIETLQADSSIRILPVSPAPTDQRSSYFQHTQSKVTSVEESLEIVDSEPRVMSCRSQGKSAGLRLPPAQNDRQHEQTRVGSTAVLTTVLPEQKENKPVTVVVTRHKLVTSPTSTTFPSSHSSSSKSHTPTSVDQTSPEGVQSPGRSWEDHDLEKLPPVSDAPPTGPMICSSKVFQASPVSSSLMIEDSRRSYDVKSAWSEGSQHTEHSLLRELSLPPLKSIANRETSISEFRYCH